MDVRQIGDAQGLGELAAEHGERDEVQHVPLVAPAGLLGHEFLAHDLPLGDTLKGISGPARNMTGRNDGVAVEKPVLDEPRKAGIAHPGGQRAVGSRRLQPSAAAQQALADHVPAAQDLAVRDPVDHPVEHRLLRVGEKPAVAPGLGRELRLVPFHQRLLVASVLREERADRGRQGFGRLPQFLKTAALLGLARLLLARRALVGV